jgi:hypothetical protein
MQFVIFFAMTSMPELWNRVSRLLAVYLHKLPVLGMEMGWPLVRRADTIHQEQSSLAVNAANEWESYPYQITIRSSTGSHIGSSGVMPKAG